VVGNGTHRRIRVCTRCLRSGRVRKPAVSTRTQTAS
jgi:ribosomal protein L28